MAKAKTCDAAHRFFHASRQLDKTDLTAPTPVPVSSVQRQSRLSDKGRESFQNHHLQKVGGGKQKKEEEQRLKLKMQVALLKQQKADRLASQVKVEVEVNLVAVKLEALQDMEDRERTEELVVDLKPSVKHIHALKLEPTDPLVAVISMDVVKGEEEEEVEPIVQILDIVASTSSQAYDSIPCATKDKAPSPPAAPLRWSRSMDKGKGKMIEQNNYHPRYQPYTPSPLSRPPINRSPSSSPAPPDLFLPPSPISSEPEQSTVLVQCVTSASAPLSEPKNEGIRMASSQSQTRAENHGIRPQSGRDTPKARPPKPPKPPPSYLPREEEHYQPNWENPFQLPTTSNSTTSHSPQPRFTTTYDWPVYQLPPPSPPVIKPFGSREKEKENSEG